MTKLQNNTISLLKKINFTLLILTTVIVLFSFFSSKSNVDRAVNDLENLESVFVKVSKGGTPLFGKEWLNKYIQDYLEEYVFSDENGTSNGIDCFFSDDNATWRLNISNYYLDFFNEEQFNTYLDTSMTLRKVKSFWNNLNQTNKIYVATSCPKFKALYEKGEEKFKYYELEKPDTVNQFSPTPYMSIVDVTQTEWINNWFPKVKDISNARELLIQMTYKPNVSSKFYAFGDKRTFQGYDFRRPGTYAVTGDWKDVDYSLIETTFNNKVFYPLSLSDYSFLPIEELVRNSPKDYNWKKGNFRTNFKELDKLTIGFQDLPLDKLKVILNKDSKNLVDSINIFGVKIPYSIVNRFGIIAIIVVQLYFGIYLNQLKLESPSEIPWMLLHKSSLSRIVFYLTAIFYPAIVVLNLSVINMINTGWFTKDILICIIELIIFCWFLFLTHKKIKNYHQHFV